MTHGGVQGAVRVAVGPDQQPLLSGRHRLVRALRRGWRVTVRRRWHRARPLVLLALGISALVLGTIGYLQLRSATPRLGVLDSLYRAITLFAFGGAATPPIPLALQIARILAPVLTGYAAIGTVLALFREETRVLGIRLFVRRHVIVAGLGATGSRLALALVDHEPVVTIEADPTNARLAAAGLRGVRTLVGEATDELVLRRAGIRHASSVVVTCGSDGTNVDVAAAAAKLAAQRRRPLTIFAQLADLDLWSSLAAEGATFGTRLPRVRLEYFNVLATAAQLWLEQQPPTGTSHPADAERSSHVLIVGLEGVGEQLVLQIARMWGPRDPGEPAPPRLTIAGPEAKRQLADLEQRYPALERYCGLDARQMSIGSAAFQAGGAMVGPDDRCDVTDAYVALPDEGDALLAALALHARPDTLRVPVRVGVADAGAGIALVVESDEGRFGGITSFGVMTAATSEELLLRGTNELLARAQHAQWMRREQQRKTTGADNPNLRLWEELDEAQRETNRRFADDLHAKLELIGAMLVPAPLPDPAEPPFEFTADELELLARQEHERWMKEKLETGWRYGPHRDNDRKIHDQLKPWEELDEPNRDKDREAVEEIPQILAQAGFGIRRGAQREPAGSAHREQSETLAAGSGGL